MSLDVYTSCPCGSAKKVKFCCGKQVLHELEKIFRAIDGDQRLSARDQAIAALTAKGEIPSLLAVLLQIELELGETDSAKKTVERLLKVEPTNAIGAGAMARLHASEDRASDAVQALQDAFEALPSNEVPYELAEAAFETGHALLRMGAVIAGRQHLGMALIENDELGKSAYQAMSHILSERQIPLVLKMSLIVDLAEGEVGDDVPWKQELETALTDMARGCWRRGRDQLLQIDTRHPNQPAIVRRVAIAHTLLHDVPNAVAAWQRYAALEDVDLEDAVEAELLATTIDDEPKDVLLDVVEFTFAIRDMDTLSERLMASPLVQSLSPDAIERDSEDGPPPKFVFAMLDKEIVSDTTDLTLEQVASSVADVLLYGKETDRDARLEIVYERADGSETNLEALQSIAGDALGDQISEEVTAQMPLFSYELSTRWRLPLETPLDVRERLGEEHRRQFLFERWPDLPEGLVEGKTIREAAAEPELRNKVLAAILRIELIARQSFWKIDLNDIRKELNLPTLETVDPWSCDLKRLSILRLSRMDALKMSDDDLQQTFVRAATVRVSDAVLTFGEEILRRDSSSNPDLEFHVHRAMIENSPSPFRALDYIERAIQSAKARGQSPAIWLLQELSMRLACRQPEECQRVLQTLATNHINEPGVGEALDQFLKSIGAYQQMPAAQAGPAGGPPAGEPASGVWTPDSSGPANPPPSSQSEKSKLWVPGMD